MKKRKVLAALAAVAVFLSAFLGGCGKNADSTLDEATKATAVSTSSVAATDASKQESTPADTVDTKPAVTEAQIQTQAQINDYNDNSLQEDNQFADEETGVCTLIVDGESYTAEVGDTVTYVFNLKTPDALEDFQASTNYDSSMLELLSTDVQDMFPVAGKVVICNTELENIVKYNAVNLEGMDFTKGGEFIRLDFRVIDSGSTAVSTTLEYMDSVKSEPYVSDYRIMGDIEYSEEIK